MADEKRLIDVNKVINSMQKCLDKNTDEKGSVAYFAFESIIECLKQEPTVDAVEVVRCGECEYFDEPFCRRRDDETHRERINMLTVDFCSYGNKKNGGGSNGI